MQPREAAWAFAALALALLAGPLRELGERSASYHDMVDIPGTTKAWMPVGLHASHVVLRDDQDTQYKWWRSHVKSIVATVVVFVGISRVLDQVMLRAGGRRLGLATALRIHAVVDILLSCLFLWKLYGLYLWCVPAQAALSYALVALGRRSSSRKVRVAWLAAVWVLNVALVYNSRAVQDAAFAMLGGVEIRVKYHPILRFLRLFHLGPGELQWHSNMRFGLFRAIDFATSELLRGPSAAPKRKSKKAVPEWLGLLQYAMYAPLVWQGPIIGYRTFRIQAQRRFREVNGRLQAAQVPWRKSLRLLAKLLGTILIREVIDHTWFARMFVTRHVHTQMRSGEVAAAILVLFVSAYMRMLLTWRYFRLWALLDGVEAIDNFPRCAFRNTSVGDMWRNMNASVHVWILGNIYAPLCEGFQLHRRWGVVATFAFMAFWHGMFPAWIMFATVNAGLILLEQEAAERPRLQAWVSALSLPARLLVMSLSWAARMLTLLVFWINLKSPASKQLEMSRSRVLFGRAFFDESVSATVARDYGIDNGERNGGTPALVLAGAVVFLMSVRIAVYFFDKDISDHDAAQAASDRGVGSGRIAAKDHDHDALRREAREHAKSMRSRALTIVEVLSYRARAHGDEIAMTWLDDKGSESRSLTYAELGARAVDLSRELSAKHKVAAGDRVVLVFAPGLEFVVAFFACLYAGAVAVPVYPPRPDETDRDVVFRGVLADCSPRLILSDAKFTLARRSAQAWVALEWTGALLCVALGLALPVGVEVLLARVKLALKKVKRQEVWLPDAEWKGPGDAPRPEHWLEVGLLALAVLVGVVLVLRAGRFLHPRIRRLGSAAQSDQMASIPWARVSLGAAGRWQRFPGRKAAKDADEDFSCATAARDPWAVAYLQYTSGSTGTPKGVRIMHDNIMHQGFVNQVAFGCRGRGETAVNWCPQYHDLGLVVCILSGIYAGIRLVSFSPLAFLRDPLLWVRAVSKYQASFSAAPNFAYAYAARKARAAAAAGEGLCGLDLSSWRIAGNGGEPVRARALEAFADAFGRFGFARRAAFPCYGLAEHTIMVSGAAAWQLPTYLGVRREALANHRVEVASREEGSGEVAWLVGCGEPFEEVEVRIVDPETLQQVASPSHVGEIWLRSPSVADGYWGQSAASNEAVFAAACPGDAVSVSGVGFLRTGDLGFVREGELFVCGRCKDLIIVDGRNIYPQDVEACAERAAQALRPGSSAAFSSAAGIVLVAEMRREAGAAGQAAFRRACQAAYRGVLREQRIGLAEMITVKTGVLPKTSSGKVRRSAVAALVEKRDAAFERGVVFRARGAELASEADIDASEGTVYGDLLTDPVYTSILECILAAAAQGSQGDNHDKENDDAVLQESLDAIIVGADRGQASFSSLEAVQFAASLEARLAACGLDLTLPPDVAFRHTNVGALALYVYDAAMA